MDPDFEKQFPLYRERLQQELQRLMCFVRIFRRLEERKRDRLAVMNIAPAFFTVTADALYTAIIIWVNKLLDENGDRGFFNFLTYVEYNREGLTTAALKKRRKYPDDHWMLKGRDEVSLQRINGDRDRLRALSGLASFRIRRDKFQAHFDRQYFFDPASIAADAPLAWNELDHAIRSMKEILNGYSASFDGNVFSVEPLNATDVDRLLDFANRAQEVRAQR